MQLPALVIFSTLLINFANSDGCINYDSTNNPFCYDLFRRLENQITGNDANLYSLHKVFYPTSHAEPSLVNVSYDLHVSSAENRSCSGDPESKENPRYDHLPNKHLQLLKAHAWSSKTIYTLYHPATMNRLQPQVVQMVLSVIAAHISSVPTALKWDTTGPILTVELYIDLKLPCWPTFLALEGSLYDLTSFLKVYADTQANVTSWDAEEKGYALFGSVFIYEWWLNIDRAYPSNTNMPYINLTISVFFTAIICFGIYNTLWNIVPANTDQKNFLFSYIILWCSVGLLVQMNISSLFFEVNSILKWCDYKMSCQEPAAKSKIGLLLWMVIYMTISFVVLLVHFVKGKTQYRAMFIPEWRVIVIINALVSFLAFLLVVFYNFFIIPLLKINKISNFCTHLQKSLSSVFRCPVQPNGKVLENIIQFAAAYILYTTVFVTASMFTFSFLPTLLQTFIYPFRLVGVLCFFFSSVAVYFLTAFIATFLWKEKPPTIKRLLLCLLATVVACVFINFLTWPFVAIYQLLVTGSLSDNPLILFGASVLPSLLLSSPLVWLFKSEFIKRFIDSDEKDDSRKRDNEVNHATMQEEDNEMSSNM